jgi:hypothetical protein
VSSRAREGAAGEQVRGVWRVDAKCFTWIAGVSGAGGGAADQQGATPSILQPDRGMNRDFASV